MTDAKQMVVAFLLWGAVAFAGILIACQLFGRIDCFGLITDDRDRSQISAKKFFMFCAFWLHCVCTLYAVMSGLEAAAVLFVFAASWISPVLASQVGAAIAARNGRPYGTPYVPVTSVSLDTRIGRGQIGPE